MAGGFLAAWSWRGPFFISLLAIPALVLAILFIDEPAQTARVDRAERPLPFPWRDALPIGALTLFASLLYYVEPLHIAQLFAQAGVTSPAIAGIVQALTTVGYVAGAVLYRQPARRPIEQHMAVSWLFMGAGLLLIGASAALPGITVGATIQQLGAGFTIPALLAWGQARLSYQQRGRGMGLWTTSFFVGTFLCPPLMTGLSDAMGGLRPAVSLAGALCLAGALVSAWKMRRETHQLRFSRG